MRAVLIRVSSASVSVDGHIVGSIDAPNTGGVLALVGVGRNDAPDAWKTMARKIAELRILEGEKSVSDANAPVLLVSQFTLMGATAKGRRPSWVEAAPGKEAEPIIEKIAAALKQRGIHVEEGQFGATMEVASVNQGPFTVIVDC
ncbi:D-tyrosyl-tRNA(Tyr) deacylase [Corynebacterium pseudotuberculosis]|uniref:D-aminoacyl-tRNA deacylase n=1 Tax=Corynebacterium pseudotuberculosis 258 TaxID=1168865 RepID=A0AAU8PZ83_CORPS|nr:D-aminoacyl-tRNA deacylase [Corynebacterium pseudotuberculosis]AER69260.1 D-tyrosyl-tRNA(Tyr) deacylase [Corynebacterium pseudotuberculosis 1/06-A]AEQ06768.1 D-tyrosyl-tRNA(Tyr) deacylase [Corynebacterium pseudotuberculosis CIP 52.97]AFB72568.1 D-tyrosyl-tRNA(Tyr) deacylase [Corynebacterium pseudotuberculosis 316]AFH91036.1 D-tyrosyl-tRNA(Tyr) deacylase [Corynebacterium pseudotuberculosis 31]AFK16861.1 D-tyrosyl-tRNA(Tyr) deacylase [Corynebacterium pseudotuberculosis 258]